MSPAKRSPGPSDPQNHTQALHFTMLKYFFLICEVNAEYLLLETKIRGMVHGDRMAEAWRSSERRGDGFAGLVGHSAH